MPRPRSATQEGARTEAEQLVERLRRSVRDERVLEALARVPRERFVAPGDRERAFENVPLEIGCGQTISQPLVVARMLELLELRPGDRVLDVGTGSGYHAALLAALVDHVWTIERHPELAERAAAGLVAAGVANVTVLVGDGAQGHPPAAPFDAINVAAAAWPAVPPALETQLGPGGRLVAPVGAGKQRLMRIRRANGELERETLERVRFVPLVPGKR